MKSRGGRAGVPALPPLLVPRWPAFGLSPCIGCRLEGRVTSAREPSGVFRRQLCDGFKQKPAWLPRAGRGAWKERKRVGAGMAPVWLDRTRTTRDRGQPLPARRRLQIREKTACVRHWGYSAPSAVLDMGDRQGRRPVGSPLPNLPRRLSDATEIRQNSDRHREPGARPFTVPSSASSPSR